MRGLPVVLLCLVTLFATGHLGAADSTAAIKWNWEPLPPLPDQLGVAGPFVGVHDKALIVAGGANFPEPVWENEKAWYNNVWVLVHSKEKGYDWRGDLKLDRPVAYGACVTTPAGVACLGGNDGRTTFSSCFLLTWDAGKERIIQTPLPALPSPCAYGAAALIGETIYLAGGQGGADLDTAMDNFWRLDLSKRDDENEPLVWEKLPPWPGPARAFNLTIAQHNGFDDCIYVISGRRQESGTSGVDGIALLTDVYEFNPKKYDPSAYDPDSGEYRGTGRFARPWRKRAEVPHCVMAGTGIGVGQSHILVVSGADGTLMARAAELKDDHPGFPKRLLSYHTITDTWIDSGESPANQVTTPAVRWGSKIVVASGEVRPRVRSPKIWSIEPVARSRSFGAINFSVLVVYLLAMVGVGVYFARRNKNTDDYFRGGQRIPWWVAGCSIFATMLSSITFMAIPAKAYAQDLVYLIGNFMILGVAPVAVFIALPFFRQINATSAYEYLEKRFSLPTRLFGSASFTIFHIFRMGIVMSLASLALATVTPMTPTQCVLIMGVLSIIYCTMGGVEAVVWTDTIQTFVLLGGALLCFGLMVAGSDGGIQQFFTTASTEGKFHLANLHLDPTSASLALWVIIFGAFGQNFSSYTADQAVVQRYMTTPDQKRAASAIWTNAWLSMPASILFYALGTALFVFYKSHPEKLDPTFTTDQIFPLFIANEVPIGIAGLIVAGIFAAAQSTISTSMNSTATTVVTDFMRPFNAVRSERGYLGWARGLTFMFGVLGTMLGLLFVNPDIKSLFDQFIKVIGLFMGVLGGLFALGILTTRANGPGSIVGAVAGVLVMALMPVFTQINGYLYAVIGIAVCFIVGYMASLFIPTRRHDLEALTIYTIHRQAEANGTATDDHIENS